jgi:hypothetical protein
LFSSAKVGGFVKKSKLKILFGGRVFPIYVEVFPHIVKKIEKNLDV